MRGLGKLLFIASVALAVASVAVSQPPFQQGDPGGKGGQKGGKGDGIAGKATPVERFKLAKDFKIELLYSVPQGQGSWVSMCVDGQDRLIVSDQGGAGLFQITPPAIGGKAADTKVEKLPANISGAQGLLWAFDSLYVVVNGGGKGMGGNGLYRVKASKPGGPLDQVQQLHALNGGGEHGPHAVLLSPDGKSLFVVCGNDCKLTTLSGSRVPRLWGEDRLFPLVVEFGGVMRPAGHIYKVDPEGKNWELWCAGFRNPYDMAFNRHGDLFTFDSDMEYDMNQPWYRPTRVNMAVSGADFGFRNGSANAPPRYPDTLPAICDIGPGSPTGVCFGYGAKFPAKYQEALYLSDWSYGRLFAMHLTPDGSAYKAEVEEFVTGTPMPITDLVVNPKDGALYFAIGGRNAQSGLYRVTYIGKESTAPFQPSPAAGGGQGGGDNSMLGGAADVGKIFDTLAKGADAIVIANMSGFWQGLLTDFAKEGGITNGKITRQQFIALGQSLVTKLQAGGFGGGNPAEARALRHKLEAFHGKANPNAVSTAWPYLGHEDRYIRFAARTAIEHQDVKQWQDLALKETNPAAAINALLALVRAVGKDPITYPRKVLDPNLAGDLKQPGFGKGVGGFGKGGGFTAPAEDLYPIPGIEMKAPILAALEKIDWDKLSNSERSDLLRVYTLVFSRLGSPDRVWRNRLIKRFDPVFPVKNYEVNADLCQLLVYLEAPGVAEKALKLMAAAPSQEEQIDYAKSLARLETGWTDALRKDYRTWFAKAATFRGGQTLEQGITSIGRVAMAQLNAKESEEFAAVLNTFGKKGKAMAPAAPAKPRPLVKQWTIAELTSIVEKGLTRRDFERGRELFGTAKCFACHRFDSEGGTWAAPDLTTVSARFSIHDILESIIEPSKVISDQYASTTFTLKDGRVLTGRVVNMQGANMSVMTDMLSPSQLTGVNVNNVESMQLSSISPMPTGLLDTFHEDEILDLMAYLLSRGDRKHEMFKK